MGIITDKLPEFTGDIEDARRSDDEQIFSWGDFGYILLFLAVYIMGKCILSLIS